LIGCAAQSGIFVINSEGYRFVMYAGTADITEALVRGIIGPMAPSLIVTLWAMSLVHPAILRRQPPDMRRLPSRLDAWHPGLSPFKRHQFRQNAGSPPRGLQKEPSYKINDDGRAIRMQRVCLPCWPNVSRSSPRGGPGTSQFAVHFRLADASRRDPPASTLRKEYHPISRSY
jgi:hypothetical protein